MTTAILGDRSRQVTVTRYTPVITVTAHFSRRTRRDHHTRGPTDIYRGAPAERPGLTNCSREALQNIEFDSKSVTA